MAKKSKKTISPEISENITLEAPTTLKPLYVFLGLAVGVFLSYAMVWKNGFVWDDDPYIKLNEAVKTFDLNSLLTGFHVGNYHPLTMLTLALEYLLVGESTWLYHFNNLVLHTINSYLIFKILRYLDFSEFVGLITAVFFALHPLHVESVAWAAERKDVLYTLFLLLSFFYYLKVKKEEKKSFYAISLAFFVLACFSKGMAVVLPALLIITDWWILKKPFSVKELLDKIPYFVVTLIFAYIATHAQKDAGADATAVINAAYTPFERFKIVSYSFLMYWVKAIFPVNLIPFYPYPPKIDGSIPGIFSLAALGFILFAIAAFLLGRKNKLIWWAVSFFVIAISTVIQILPVGSAIFADRYFYLSSIGPLFLFALGLDYLKKKSSMFQGFGYLIALIFAAITFFQTTHWKNLYTLFKPAEESYPEDAMVLSNLGWYYLGINDFPMSKQYLQRADNNGFKNADVCRTLGSMFVDEQNYPEALKYIEKSREFLPISPRTEWLTALAMLRTGQFEKALPYSEKAIEQNPTDFDFLTTHAQILTELKMYDKAEAANKEIIRLYPDKYDTRLNLAFLERLRGNLQKEISMLDKLISLAPSYLPAYRNIGVSLSELGENDKAVEYWQRAIVYDTTGDYEYNIGINYANRGKIEVAKEYYIKAAKKGKPEAIQILKNNGVSF
jgi:protein O-mannosyl-transferase